MMEWISVEDRLPSDETPVLLKLEKQLLRSDMQVGYYKNGKPFVIATIFAFDAPKITHWAEITPPKK